MSRSSKLEDLKSWKKLICLIAIIGVLLFIILTSIAMLFYPDHFSLTDNYYSDLGTPSTVKNGLPNVISSSIFLIACMITGLSLIPFWIVLSRLYIRTKINYFLAFSGTLTGILSAISLIALAIFPYSIFIYEHDLASKAFYLFFAIALLLYSIFFFLIKVITTFLLHYF